MAYEYKATRTVEFSDTDMAGIMHFSNFFRFMETAEHGFYRAIGFSVVSRDIDPPVGWPRVHAACEYKRPLRFEDRIEIHLLVKEKRSKSITYLFRFRKLDDPVPGEVARGTLTVVCVKHDGAGKMSATTIPARIAECIDVAPAELLAETGRQT